MTEEAKLALRQTVRTLRGGDPPEIMQEDLADLLGYAKDRISKFERSGPTVDSLPKLAGYAVKTGRLEQALVLLKAFFEEYPDLIPAMRALKSVREVANLEGIDITDVAVQQLCTQVDRVIKSRNEAARKVLEGSIKIAVELSKLGG